MIIRALFLYGLLLIVPFVLGMLYTGLSKEHQNSIVKNWVGGVIILWMMFQLITIPFLFLKQSLTHLIWIYGGIIGVLLVISIWKNHGRYGVIISEVIGRIKGTPWIFAVAAILLIGLQMYVYVNYMHTDADDSFYVVTAVTAEKTDTLYQYNTYTGELYKSFPARYVLAPFPIFVALLSRLSGIHATIIAHTLLPVILLLLAYAVFLLIGYELFRDDREKTACFLCVLAVVNLFSGYTTHAQGMVMLVRIWQGKAVLASVILPLIFYMFLKMQKNEFARADWILLFGITTAGCMLSSMGIMLGAIMVGILGLAMMWQKRSLGVLVRSLLCCLPNICYALIYLYIS